MCVGKTGAGLQQPKTPKQARNQAINLLENTQAKLAKSLDANMQ